MVAWCSSICTKICEANCSEPWHIFLLESHYWSHLFFHLYPIKVNMEIKLFRSMPISLEKMLILIMHDLKTKTSFHWWNCGFYMRMYLFSKRAFVSWVGRHEIRPFLFPSLAINYKLHKIKCIKCKQNSRVNTKKLLAKYIVICDIC